MITITSAVGLIAGINALSGDHMAESGAPTAADMLTAEKWFDSVTSTGKTEYQDGWLQTALPFSFRYGDRESDDFLKDRNVSAGSTPESRTLVWQDSQTGLEVKWEIRHIADFPAVGWVLRLKNTGSKDTPLIEAMNALRLKLNSSLSGKAYTVYGANGGRSRPDDMAPVTWHSGPGSESWTLGGTYSSNEHLPFWNVETPDGQGVAGGFGWSRQWIANFNAKGSELTMLAGLKECSTVLRPGEEIRSPSILLVFWHGKRLHGHNLLRQVLHKHFIYPLKGEPQKPLVTVNTCFTHHNKGHWLIEATEEPVLSLVEPFAKIGAEAIVIDAGWYKCVGNWSDMSSRFEMDPEKYPNGFKRIAEALSKHKMDFGVWFEPTGLGHPSDPVNTDCILDRVDILVENEGMTM